MILVLPKRKWVYHYDFCIHQNYRSKCLDKILLKNELLIQKSGYSEFNVGVENDNSKARCMYKKYIFTKIKEVIRMTVMNMTCYWKYNQIFRTNCIVVKQLWCSFLLYLRFAESKNKHLCRKNLRFCKFRWTVYYIVIFLI